MHVAAAVGWGIAQSISNAAEGITWGILLAVCVLRIPKTWRVWMPAVRDSLWLTLLAWSLWMALSTAWSPVPAPGLRPWVPDRWILTPLMLWPVMARPWIVLAAVGIGASVQVAAAIVMSLNAVSIDDEAQLRSISGFGQLQWQLHCAAVLSASALRAAPMSWKAVPGAGLAGAMFSIAWAGRRMTLATSLIGTVLVAFRPRPGRWTGLALIAGLLLTVIAAAALPFGSRIGGSVRAATGSFERQEVYSALATLSGARFPLAHAALELGLRHPIIGNGHGSFRTLAVEWALEQGAAHPERRAALGPVRSGRLNDAHNALLQAFAEGGLVAAALLGIVVVGLAARLWRQSNRSFCAAAGFAIFASILLGMFCYPITAKAPGAIVGICLSVSWGVAGQRPGDARP